MSAELTLLKTAYAFNITFHNNLVTYKNLQQGNCTYCMSIVAIVNQHHLLSEHVHCKYLNSNESGNSQNMT